MPSPIATTSIAQPPRTARRMSIRRVIPLLSAALLLIGLGAAQAEATGVDFAVSPSRLIVEGVPGAVSEQVVTVYNTGAARLDLRLLVSDFLVDDQTTAASTFAVTSWVSTTASELSIDPGKQADVHVVVDVPAGAAPGGYQAGLYLVSVPDLSDPVAVSGRLGVPVLVELPREDRPLRRELQVVDQALDVEFPDGFSLEALFSPAGRSRTHVINLGETFVRVVTIHRFRSWADPAGVEVTAPGTTLLRASSGVLTTSEQPLPWIGPASVTTEVVYERGAQDYATIVVQAEAFIVPWRLLGLLAIAAVLAAVAGRISQVVAERRRRSMPGGEALG